MSQNPTKTDLVIIYLSSAIFFQDVVIRKRIARGKILQYNKASDNLITATRNRM